MNTAQAANEQGVRLADSITRLEGDVTGVVVVSGSHGGTFAALVGGARGAKALVFNDAGVGKDRAGIGGLVALEEFGIAAATVDHRSARIGDAGESYAFGRISFVNAWAAAADVAIGSAAGDAVDRLKKWARVEQKTPEMPVLRVKAIGPIPGVIVLDSASSITSSMASSIVVTGSHGGLVGGFALKYPVVAAFFNDAGFGKDNAGVSRVSSLDKMRIAAAAVSHESARIGDGLDSYTSGRISFVNDAASAAGVFAGQTVQAAVLLLSQRTLS